jgi:hypothetical protein
LAFWRERWAGRCKAPRRRQCGDIAEERQCRRCPPAAAPRKVAALQGEEHWSRSRHVGHNVIVTPRAATKCQVILARALSTALPATTASDCRRLDLRRHARSPRITQCPAASNPGSRGPLCAPTFLPGPWDEQIRWRALDSYAYYMHINAYEIYTKH